MKLKLNLTQKFLLPVVVAFGLIAVVLGFEVSLVLRQAMTDHAKTFIVDVVRIQAKEYFSKASDFTLAAGQENQGIYDHLLNEIKTDEVARIKIWGSDTTVLYSDDKTLIGQKFPDNETLHYALGGQIASEIVEPTESENVSEKGYKQLMELYVPIYLPDSAKPAGVIEIYYKLDSLNLSIAATSRIIYGLITGAFALLAILFYFLANRLILSPLTVLNAGIKEIEKGNLNKKIPVGSSDEIGLLSKAFNEMVVGLKRLGELKNEFVFVAAHELRSPVTAIRGYISLIRDYPGLTLPDEIKENLQIIAQATQGLNQLVGDILDIARSDAGRLEIKVSECNIHDLIKTVMAELTPLVKEKHLTLTYEDNPVPTPVAADAVRLKEVIMNLLSNAIKYNQKDGSIKISHSVEEVTIATHVENSGSGIPKDEQSHIFEKFYRASSAKNSETVGTGLGLFITKELVERMNGKIWFTSEEGKNTIFSFALPVVKKN